MRSAREAANAQRRQLATRALADTNERVREAQAVEGRIRVASAEAGSGLGGSFLALTRQSDIDANRDRIAISTNLGNSAAAIESGYDATTSRLSQTANPLLAAFSGALQGATTGLSILNAISGFEDIDREQKRLDDAQRVIE